MEGIIGDIMQALKCIFCGHDWCVMSNPVTFMPQDRICRKCLKKQTAKTEWQDWE
jgi:hypothetical protein